MVDITGKKLSAALSLLKRKDKETIFYLGSSSGYIAIGTARELDKIIDEISFQWEERYRNEYNRVMGSFLPMAENCIWDRFEDPVSYAEKIIRIGNQVKTKSNTFRRAIDTWTAFKPIRDRPVNEWYSRTSTSDPGITIIIPGTEIGPYWTKEEWDRDHSQKKRGKNGNKKN